MTLQSSVALLAILAIGCLDEGPRAGDVRIVASASVLHLPTPAPGTWGEIPYTVSNRGDRPVFHGACTPTVEHVVNGHWEALPAPRYCVEILIELPAGQRVEGQVGVPGPGTYRLRMTYSDDSGMSKSSSTLSNAVTVE